MFNNDDDWGNAKVYFHRVIEHVTKIDSGFHFTNVYGEMVTRPTEQEVLKFRDHMIEQLELVGLWLVKHKNSP